MNYHVVHDCLSYFYGNYIKYYIAEYLTIYLLILSSLRKYYLNITRLLHL